MLADRYPRYCGHDLAGDDRYCPNCGRSAHEACQVRTLEADAPAPSPPQAGGTDTGNTVQPSQVKSREGRRRPILMRCFAIVLLFLMATVAGTMGEGGSGGEPGISPPERAEKGEVVEGGLDQETKKLVEGEKAVVEATGALVAQTVNHLSRSYPPELLGEAARDDLRALRPHLEQALEALEDIKRRRSLTHRELSQHYAFKMLLTYRE